eukprot:SAG11_NODE_13921_length_633_cov_0.936330_2_plen_164_part_01
MRDEVLAMAKASLVSDEVEASIRECTCSRTSHVSLLFFLSFICSYVLRSAVLIQPADCCNNDGCYCVLSGSHKAKRDEPYSALKEVAALPDRPVLKRAWRLWVLSKPKQATLKLLGICGGLHRWLRVRNLWYLPSEAFQTLEVCRCGAQGSSASLPSSTKSHT